MQYASVRESRKPKAIHKSKKGPSPLKTSHFIYLTGNQNSQPKRDGHFFFKKYYLSMHYKEKY